MKAVTRRILFATLPMVMATPLWAQAAPQAAAGEAAEATSDEIIVTARRRDENISKVPIAITAIRGEDLAKRAIYNENDLQSAVPGLVIRQNGGVHAFNYAIRGQSVDTFTNSPPSVLPYVNDVQIVTHSASTFYDMAGIQVLKGPQGTLFGRNATGGAVLYQTAKATDQFGGYIQGRYGNYQARHVEGAINTPLGDNAALRIAGSYSGGGGFVRDFYTRDQYGDLDQKSVRATLRFGLGEAFENSTVVQYTKEDGTNTPYELWSTNRCGTSAQGLVDAASCALNAASNPAFAAYLAAHPAVFQGGVDAAIAFQRQLGPWEVLTSYPPFHRAKSYYAINTSTYELSPEMTLKNIFGYNRSRSNDGYDYDSSPYHFFENQGVLTADARSVIPTAFTTTRPGFRLETRQISDEFQIQGKAFDGALDYVFGVYYLDQKFQVSSNLAFGNFLPAAPPFNFTYSAAIKTKSLAGFGQLTYRLTDQLSLTGGFRYTRDKTSTIQLPGSLFLSFFPANTPEKQKASKPSWTVSIDYKVTPELLIYAAQRGSWRSGGYNYSVPPLNVTAAGGGNRFLPETTYDVEVGAKYSGDSLGMPMTMNVDVYSQWVKDIQRAAYILTPAGVSLLTVNVPRARIQGFEGDFSLRPSQWIQFGASINYTKAKYTNGLVNVLGSTINYGPFADVPKFSGTIFGEVGTPLGNDMGALRLRVDAYGQTRMHFSNVEATANPNTTLPGYSLINARLTWEDVMATKLNAALFVRNAFKKEYYAGGNPSSSGGALNAVNPGMPRMYGIELRYAF
jgi:iron complex outermembrane recepter protein